MRIVGETNILIGTNNILISNRWMAALFASVMARRCGKNGSSIINPNRRSGVAGHAHRQPGLQADGTALLQLDAATAQTLAEAIRASKKRPGQLMKQAIDVWREREFDRKALARIKKRGPTDPTDSNSDQSPLGGLLACRDHAMKPLVRAALRRGVCWRQGLGGKTFKGRMIGHQAPGLLQPSSLSLMRKPSRPS